MWILHLVLEVKVTVFPSLTYIGLVPLDAPIWYGTTTASNYTTIFSRKKWSWRSSHFPPDPGFLFPPLHLNLPPAWSCWCNWWRGYELNWVRQFFWRAGRFGFVGFGGLFFLFLILVHLMSPQRAISAQLRGQWSVRFSASSKWPKVGQSF